MGRQRLLLALILALAVAAAFYLVGTQPILPLGLDLRGGSQLTLQAKPTAEVPVIDKAKLEAVQRVLDNRINELGVSETIIDIGEQSQQIFVQLPGVTDLEQAERVLGGTAQLDFREQRQGTESQFLGDSRLLQQLQLQQEILRQSGDQAALEQTRQQITEREQSIASLFNKTGLTGDLLRDARESYLSSSGGWEVVLIFTDRGGELFADLTKKVAGTGRNLGIFLDDRLLSAPSVSARYAETGITGGQASITGSFTSQAAADLAIQLRGGALPVPVEIVETRLIGATLGQDSIRSSVVAGLLGLVLVLIFMVVYYRLPGLIADVALVLYAIFTLTIFKLLGVTLTLPGIAGFILSIGMAVDANVLIFERTREELRSGKTLYRSVESGFYRAFSSILDSNVTTLIACGALIWLGAGLVKGFAVTLGVGVLVSMFTALTCSRNLLLLTLSVPSLRKPEYFHPTRSTSALQTEQS